MAFTYVVRVIIDVFALSKLTLENWMSVEDTSVCFYHVNEFSNDHGLTIRRILFVCADNMITVGLASRSSTVYIR